MEAICVDSPHCTESVVCSGGALVMMDVATGVPAAAASGSQMDLLSSSLGACFSMTCSLVRVHLIGSVLSHVLCSFFK